MSGRQSPPRTRFTRAACSDPGITVIRVSGSLGPRAKPQLVRLTQECLRRNVAHLVLDLSEVDALGGGTARLLNEFAAERAGRGGKTVFRVTSRTVRGFLCADPNLPPPSLVAEVEEAVAVLRGRAVPRTEPATARPKARPETSRAEAATPSKPLRPPARPAPARHEVDPDPIVGEDGLFQLERLFAPEASDEESISRAEGGSGFRAKGPRPATKSVMFTAEDFLAADDEVEDDDVFDLDLGAIVEDAPRTNTAPRAHTPDELRDRLVAALHDSGVASRAFLFQRQPDARYSMVTRQGLDQERAFDARGALASSVSALRGPGFLVDLDIEELSDHEAGLLGELNCEVAMPLGRGERPEFLVFVSKEHPGDEYTLDDLNELESALRAAQERLGQNGKTEVLQAEIDDEVPVPTARAYAAEAPRPAKPTPRPAAPSPPSRGAQSLVAASEPSVASPEEARFDFLRDALHVPQPIRVSEPATTNTKGRAAPSDPGRALRRTLAQMRDILSLSQDFDAAFGTSKLLEVLVLSVVSVARVETVLFFALRDNDYRLTHQRGMPPDAIQGLRLRSDATLVQRALASSRGICIADDTRITDEERLWARQHGLVHAVPFRFKEETLGLLLLGESTDGGAPDLDMLVALLAQAGLAYDRARIYETLQERTLGVVRGLITLIEARNGFDCGSTEQVVRYTQALAREMQFQTESVRDLVYGAVLRDVGMLQVSEALLRSPADLTGDQWESIRRHPQEGAAIMRQMRFSQVATDIVLHHHEAYNGEGYPMGLRGRAIPLGARIVAVAESYVKMTMDRPYRKALGKAEALESLAENWGLRYDPLVVDALVRVVNRELSIGLKGDRDLARDLFGV